jgi:hypothetical protein
MYNTCIEIKKELEMKPCKFAKIAKIDQIIRAYDFKPMAGRTDCFVEGKVIETCNKDRGYDAYKIRVTRDCFDGREFTESGYKSLGNRVGEIVFVPHEVSFMEYDARVMNLSQ